MTILIEKMFIILYVYNGGRIRPHLNNHRYTKIKVKNIWIILRRKNIQYKTVLQKINSRKDYTFNHTLHIQNRKSGLCEIEEFFYFHRLCKKIIRASRYQSVQRKF